MTWVIWALLLIIQNASFTLVSRARNSGSLGYHGVAAVFSNGVWLICQMFLVNEFFQLFRTSDYGRLTFIFVFYTTFTVIGAVAMHYVSMRWLEKGKRRIGDAK